MARPFAVALPHTQSHHFNHILSHTRILSSISHNKFIQQPYYYCTINNVHDKLLHARRLTSISTTTLPIIPHCHNFIRTCCTFPRFPSLSLLPLCRSRPLSLHFSVLMSQIADHGPTPPQESTKTVRCVIKGRVQGVFYRNWTIENATQLDLKGWVRNRRDGSVEALFSGNAEDVDEMMQRCRRGPPDAMVTAIQADPCNEDPGTGFERRSTA